jgi:hypothetical protein
MRHIWPCAREPAFRWCAPNGTLRMLTPDTRVSSSRNLGSAFCSDPRSSTSTKRQLWAAVDSAGLASHQRHTAAMSASGGGTCVRPG